MEKGFIISKLCQNEQFKDFIDDVNEILDAPTKLKNNIIYGIIKNKFMDFSTFINSIIFILPGFIIISTKNLFSYIKNINTFHEILQYIIATILLWLFILFISKFSIFNFIDNILRIIISFDKNELFENKINITLFLLVIYFISFIVGIIIGLLFYRYKKIRNLLYYAYIKIFNQTL